jgi:hypothetical protein
MLFGQFFRFLPIRRYKIELAGLPSQEDSRNRFFCDLYSGLDLRDLGGFRKIPFWQFLWVLAG